MFICSERHGIGYPPLVRGRHRRPQGNKFHRIIGTSLSPFSLFFGFSEGVQKYIFKNISGKCLNFLLLCKMKCQNAPYFYHLLLTIIFLWACFYLLSLGSTTAEKTLFTMVLQTVSRKNMESFGLGEIFRTFLRIFTLST